MLDRLAESRDEEKPEMQRRVADAVLMRVVLGKKER